MTVLDIITQVRYRLGDTSTTGWTDDRLLALVDAGQRDLANSTAIVTFIIRVKTFFKITHS